MARLYDLTAARLSRALFAEPRPSPVPYAVQAHPEAVSLVTPELELWLTPEAAIELAADIKSAAMDAMKGRR